ncbi:hypothetical protein GCM10010238_36240 [Streptomyces griseoviridis]|uniref:Uncharacterized protein n=1 Tax=Streptomyces griseoviridis TaxID=45398 RepID=A0A918LFM0_STRGD|nr:hypothetical protein GCM10010238_36240 [Streptomyces niveoruber]
MTLLLPSASFPSSPILRLSSRRRQPGDAPGRHRSGSAVTTVAVPREPPVGNVRRAVRRPAARAAGPAGWSLPYVKAEQVDRGARRRGQAPVPA